MGLLDDKRHRDVRHANLPWQPNSLWPAVIS
jgi:hypothetical protein